MSMQFYEMDKWLVYLRAESSNDSRDSANFAAKYAKHFGRGESITRCRVAEITQLVFNAIAAQVNRGLAGDK